MTTALALAADLLDPPYADRPVEWTSERLSVALWSKQREIMESVRDNRRTAVHSCHLGGKSFTAASLVGWWIDQHVPGEAFAVTTAPTGDQVKAILWREIRRAHERGHLRGRVLQTEWKIGMGTGELVAMGRKPNDYEPTAFQGIHAPYVLVVIDEAGGIYGDLWEAADSLTGNADSRILAIGNPDDPTGYFAHICEPGSGWHVIHIDGLETPNFTGEVVPDELGRGLMSPLWQQEKLEEWGEDNPLYLSKVRGRFPSTNRNGVVQLGWAQRCKVTGAWGVQDLRLEPVRLGIDVGAGGDETVIRAMHGHVAGREWVNHSEDWEQVVAFALEAIAETSPATVKVDAIGIGWGVAGGLEAARKRGEHSATIIPVTVSEASNDPARFNTLRSEIWWEVGRELSRTGAWDLRDVADDTIAQLVAPEYRIVGGKIVVEPKAETKKRLKRSPDRADALLLAAYDPQPRGVVRMAGTVHHGGTGRKGAKSTKRRDGGYNPRGDEPDLDA